MSRLSGKVAVVTGGGAGIGKATCLLFAEEGASVVIAEQNETTGAQVAAEISASGGTALFVPTDVSDESSVKSMVAAAVGKFGTIHVLVNNAAVFHQQGLDASVEAWRKNFDVNVIGLALVSKHVVPEMRRAGGGAIVNLASISAFIAQPNLMTYNATKGAIVAVTRCMALDLARHTLSHNISCGHCVEATEFVRVKQGRLRLAIFFPWLYRRVIEPELACWLQLSFSASQPADPSWGPLSLPIKN